MIFCINIDCVRRTGANTAVCGRETETGANPRRLRTAPPFRRGARFGRESRGWTVIAVGTDDPVRPVVVCGIHAGRTGASVPTSGVAHLSRTNGAPSRRALRAGAVDISRTGRRGRRPLRRNPRPTPPPFGKGVPSADGGGLFPYATHVQPPLASGGGLFPVTLVQPPSTVNC
jgi:hypothetical protein